MPPALTMSMALTTFVLSSEEYLMHITDIFRVLSAGQNLMGLYMAYKEEGVRPFQLARALEIDVSSASRVFRLLKQVGLVTSRILKKNCVFYEITDLGLLVLACVDQIEEYEK